MVEEIKQGDKVVLSSEDGFSVPMIFNNICGKKLFRGGIPQLYQVCSL